MNPSTEKTLPTVTLDIHEFERLQSIERTWSDIYFALQKGNPDCFHTGLNGRDGALAEIQRLQTQLARVRHEALRLHALADSLQANGERDE